MGRSNKRERREPDERPLPPRERLERTPDFPPFVKVIFDPQTPDLPHTPALDPPEWVATAWAEVSEQRHLECAHRFEWDGAARFGYATCSLCSLSAWSKHWVRAGLYGLAATLASPIDDVMDETWEWIAKTEAGWQARL